MVFSGMTFLLLFLPCVLTVYYLSPKCLKNTVLFFFSLLFYAWGEPIYVGLMLFSTVLDYCCGRAVEKYRGTGKAKITLMVSVIVNLSLLCLFKYADFLIGTVNRLFGSSLPLLNLPLPIGISFYTFQTMSYTIDVYRGDAKAQKNILSFGAYVTLFPQLIAGPIVRYQTIADQIDDRTHSFDRFGEGVRRFVCGLGKKVLLANNIGLLWSTVSEGSGQTVVSAWLGILAFAFQIYFDFSGYSDMAIGLGKMFGFEFLENFDYPYISKSITEFWRRWHISMGTWFRDYVYIPLGGNRKGLPKQLRNIAIVWLLTGFWHGAEWNFILWGLYFFVFLVLEKAFLLKFLEKHKILSHIYLIFLILVGWAIFQITDMAQLGLFLQRMFAFDFSLDWLYYLRNYAVILLIGILFSTPLPEKLYKRLEHLRLVPVLVCGVILAVCVAYLVDASYNPFLYFRF
ncbi:MAG TPA: transcriptional regulator [Ruminococcaceae bacterium]|nr:transcriptional regulator [Oscillospiraceae bacterium]